MKLSRVARAQPISPLRYPGGKLKLAPYVAGVVEENFLTGCTFYEPFAGGSSVSLELLRLKYVEKAVLVEKDPLVYAFWWAVVNDLDRLCDAVSAAPVDLVTWRQLEPLRDVLDPHNCSYSLLQLGLAGLFFNRTNFSGVMGAGPIGGQGQKSQYKIDCRFNRVGLLKSLRALALLANSIEIYFGDALAFLKSRERQINSERSFVYVDPPYFLQGPKLYRHSYKSEDHVALAAYLQKSQFPWLLSYDDVPQIRQLYSSSEIQNIYLDYNVKSSRTAKEVVISNLRIPPPVYDMQPVEISETVVSEF